MNGELRYGGVALGVEAALPMQRGRKTGGYARLRRSLSWLYAVLKRWA